MAALSLQEVRPKAAESCLTLLSLTSLSKTTSKSCQLSFNPAPHPLSPPPIALPGSVLPWVSTMVCHQSSHWLLVFSQRGSERDQTLHGSPCHSPTSEWWPARQLVTCPLPSPLALCSRQSPPQSPCLTRKTSVLKVIINSPDYFLSLLILKKFCITYI